MWQYIIIAIVLVLAAVYAFRKVKEAFSSAGDPCSGCAGCALHDKLKAQQKLSKQCKKPVCYQGKQV